MRVVTFVLVRSGAAAGGDRAAIAGATTYLSQAAHAYGLTGAKTKVAVLFGPEALTILETSDALIKVA